MDRRKGRRPGQNDTRGTILEAAREAFAESGYDKASIRGIAARAGVDPALIHHYFGTKEKLFQAVLQLPIESGEIMPKITGAGPEGLAENLVRTFLAVWEDPVSGPAIAGAVRSAATHRRAAGLIREFFATQIVRRLMNNLSDRISPQEIPFRASLVSSQLFGLALTRYIWKLEPLASRDLESVVTAVAPTVHRYLFEMKLDA